MRIVHYDSPPSAWIESYIVIPSCVSYIAIPRGARIVHYDSDKRETYIA